MVAGPYSSEPAYLAVAGLQTEIFRCVFKVEVHVLPVLCCVGLSVHVL